MIIIDNLAEPKHFEFTKARTEYLLNQNLNATILTVDNYKIPAYELLDESQQVYGFILGFYLENYPETVKESSKIYQVHYLSQYITDWHKSMGAKTSLFYQSVSLAFDNHINLSLDPDSIWYCIVHELAIHIEKNQNRYRGYFTVSDKREELEVALNLRYCEGPPEQWKTAIPLFMEPIREWVPRATIDLLMPRFSTTTEVKRLSLFALFMNVLSNYYQFLGTTRCGIPSIRIEGTADDWKKIVDHTELASKEFDGLKAYFDDLIPVLKEIAGVAGGEEPDPDFWRSIYKYKSRSGGDGVDGWITTLFAHHQETNGSFRLKPDFDWRKTFSDDEYFANLNAEGIPSHITTTPFIWDYLGKRINMMLVSGFMGMRYDQFLSPQLGFGVLEKQFTE